MSSFNDIIDFLLTPVVLRASVLAAILGLALCTDPSKIPRRCVQFAHSYALPVVISGLLGCVWVTCVNVFVPKPYMDEIFHVPQAQLYCQGKYTEWDNMITTPPGLYFLSIIWARLLGYQDCSADTLRKFNVFITACIAAVALASRITIEGSRKKGSSSSVYAIHTGFNIALCPILFFFSGLYYTDVISTFVVLLAYLNHRKRLDQGSSRHSFVGDLCTVVLGVLALCMRQTNVFWVVVYMGGCEAVQALKELSVKYEAPPPNSWAEQAKLFVWKSSDGAIHDPALQEAWPEDLAQCLLSIAIAAICNAGFILRRIYPRLVIVAIFAGFVVWNGGVVLGDKSNHVATIHLAQMLYIWPLFAFFSAPLFFPEILHLLRTAQSFIAPTSSPKHASSGANKQEQHSQRAVNYLGISLSALLIGGSVVLAGLIIHYNTIIHPFTLADNRHYMFYIFRYTVMRGQVIRLMLAPIYVLCAILAWTSLYQILPEVISSKAVAKTTSLGSSASTVLTSEVLILLFAIALSLMTAPLVEPRYFILPWVFWRLLVPRRIGGRQQEGWDWTLVLETLWFLVVNAILMYIFLSRPFVWKLDGQELDGGSVQRFMW